MLRLIFITAALTCILTGIWIQLSKRMGWYDLDAHQIKQRSRIPTSGGIAIFVGFWLMTLIHLGELILTEQYFGIFLASMIVMITGVVDDRYELSPFNKLLGIFIASNVVYFVSDVTFSTTLLPYASPNVYQTLEYLFTIGWLILVCNAINLIDGLDGLATSTMIISLTALIFITLNFSLSIPFVLTTMLLILLGSLFGFIPWNWMPAKVYLGDTGSLWIGFMYGVLTVTQLKNASFYSLILPMVLYAVPLIDTVFAVIRRCLKKQRITEGDNQHIHHRLLSLGLKEWQVVLMMNGITIAFSALAILTQLFREWRQVILLVIILLVIGLLAWMLWINYDQAQKMYQREKEKNRFKNQ
ncbi:undecaprenyl/decaprenyl-phosphate alpha-N-acetylglucosaminyl 1-phosphate transferase [Aerococcaceae bacterium DSM 111020]|nr:undecaprenyl/decaprenyl-phosphate alpha-N-acetylglucosaminyl 1-phosphate transferase [Aerococcaceae bacterium DSM 111020]